MDRKELGRGFWALITLTWSKVIFRVSLCDCSSGKSPRGNPMKGGGVEPLPFSRSSWCGADIDGPSYSSASHTPYCTLSLQSFPGSTSELCFPSAHAHHMFLILITCFEFGFIKTTLLSSIFWTLPLSNLCCCYAMFSLILVIFYVLLLFMF